jgi:hypothetical protein
MTHRVFFNRLSFQKTNPDDPTQPVGDPVIVNRGEKVPDWVSPFQVNALVNAGMIVNTGDEKPVSPVDTLKPFDEVPAQPRTPDQPDVLPSDPQGTPLKLVSDTGTSADEDSSASSTAAEELASVSKPSVRDSKEAWEAYAVNGMTPVDQRMSQSEAESMTKPALMAEVNTREAAASRSDTK